MNVLTIIFISIFLLWIGYRFYGNLLVKAVCIDPSKKTPAVTRCDGSDFVPAKHWSILFGHHFSSIAGAGPIVGPILAVAIWGWLPAVLWVILGTIFIGGVHDFCALVLSVRHNGITTADVTGMMVSKKARFVFLSFVWITLILIIAVFVYLCAKTFVVKPNVIIPSLGLIPTALLLGLLLYRFKLNQIIATIVCLLLLSIIWGIGTKVTVGLGPNAQLIWGIILLIYAFIASIVPVQLLLQPRDYLSCFFLFFGLLFGYLGFVSSPNHINYPYFIGWNLQAGFIWPMLFITIACGAVSGFHSLVASGTSSKQLANEKDAKKIGYGGMVAEALVALMAIMMIGIVYKNKTELMGLLSKSGPGPVGVFGQAYGEVTKNILGGFGGLFAITILNAFILTTLDTATRIARYLTQELFGIKSKYIATTIVILISAWLGLSGEWMKIWPVFGAANQLIAALTLIVVSCWLLTIKTARYTLVITIFMLFTTMGALIIKIIEYLKSKNILLLTVCGILFALASVIVFESIRAFSKGKYAYKH